MSFETGLDQTATSDKENQGGVLEPSLVASFIAKNGEKFTSSFDDGCGDAEAQALLDLSRQLVSTPKRNERLYETLSSSKAKRHASRTLVFTTDLAKDDEQIATLEDAVRHLREQCAEETRQQQEQEENTRKELTALREKLQQQERELSLRRQSGMARKEEMKDLERNIDIMQAERQKTKVEMARREAEEKESRYHLIAAHKSKLDHVIAVSLAARAELETSEASQKLQHAMKVEELMKLRTDTEHEKEAVEARLAEEMAARLRDQEEFEMALAAVNAEHLRLLEEKQEIEEALFRLEEQQPQVEQITAELQARLASDSIQRAQERALLEAQLSELRAQVDQAESERRLVEEDRSEALARRESMAVRTMALRGENEELRAALERERSEKVAASEYNHGMRKEIYDVKMDLAQREQEVRMKMEEQRADLALLEETVAQKHQELALEQERAAAEREDAVSRIRHLEGELQLRSDSERRERESIENMLRELTDEQKNDRKALASLDEIRGERERELDARRLQDVQQSSALVRTVQNVLTTWQHEAAETTIHEAMERTRKEFAIQQREQQIHELRLQLEEAETRMLAERTVQEKAVSKLKKHLVHLNDAHVKSQREHAAALVQRDKKAKELRRTTLTLNAVRRQSSAFATPDPAEKQPAEQPSTRQAPAATTSRVAPAAPSREPFASIPVYAHEYEPKPFGNNAPPNPPSAKKASDAGHPVPSTPKIPVRQNASTPRSARSQHVASPQYVAVASPQHVQYAR